MATRLAAAAQNAGADAIAALADAGAGPGIIEVYSGTQPASANDVAAGTLLATFTLADPAYGAAGAVNPGEAVLQGAPLSTTGAADGTAGWFRVKDSNGATVRDGAVGAELTLNTTTISTGVNVRIDSGTLTQPSGA